MSGQRFSAIPWQAAEDKNLSVTQLRLLIMLGKYADQTGWCYPKQRTLAERVGVARENICRAMSGLVAAGYVEKMKVKDAPKSMTKGLRLDPRANFYRVILDRPAKDICDAPDQLIDDDCRHTNNTPINTPDSSVSKDTGPEGPKGNQKKENHLTTEEPPTMSKQTWDLGIEILPGNKHRSLIGKWIKQAGGGEGGAAAVLTVLKSCQASGTRDPISYITAAMNNEHGEPPEKVDPRKYGREEWEKICDLLMQRGKYHDHFQSDPRQHTEFVEFVRNDLGPVPGSKGCLMPKDLQTPEVVALFEKRGGLL